MTFAGPRRALLTGRTFDYYVDSRIGSDTNSGKSPTSPFLTLSAAQAVTTSGTRLALASGSTWLEQYSVTASGVTVSVYGTGIAPYIDCRDVVSNGVWAKTGGQTNVYQATITLPNNVKALGNVWFDETFAVQKTSIALVDGAAGSAFVSDWTAATATLYVNLPGVQKDPSLANVAIRYSRRLYAITTTGNNCLVHGVRTRGNAHQDGSIALYGTGNVIDGCRIEDGCRHSALLAAGSLCSNTYFYQARNDLESGACSMLVVNQPDLSAASYGTSGCTFDANNVSGQTISGFDAHDAVSNRKAISCTHVNPTFMSGCLGTNDNATTQTITNPVLVNAGTFLAPANTGATTTITNLTGNLSGTARLLNSTAGGTTAIFSGGSLTVAQVGPGVVSATNTGANCNVAVSGMTWTLTATGSSVFEVFHIAAGALTLTGSTFGPVVACPFAIFANVGITTGGTITANNNTYPIGASWKLNDTLYSTLATWQATGQDAASAYGTPTVTFADDFNRANQNLEASPNWTRVDGTAGALQIVSNQCAVSSATSTAYQSPTIGSNDMYARVTVANVATSLDFGGALRVTNKTNAMGATWTNTQYKFWTCIAGSFSQKIVVSQAPILGDDVIAAARGDFAYLYVNNAQIGGPSSTGSSALTAQTPGLVDTGTIVSPAYDNYSSGPV